MKKLLYLLLLTTLPLTHLNAARSVSGEGTAAEDAFFHMQESTKYQPFLNALKPLNLAPEVLRELEDDANIYGKDFGSTFDFEGFADDNDLDDAFLGIVRKYFPQTKIRSPQGVAHVFTLKPADDEGHAVSE